MTLVLDCRRAGTHGIGRFLNEIRQRTALAFCEYQSARSPSSPLDPLVLGYELRKYGQGVFVSAGFNAPLLSRLRSVITLHDLYQIDGLPRTNARRLYFQVVVRAIANRAAAILTVSEFSRSRIAEWSGIPPEKIINVGNGISEGFIVDGPGSARRKPYVLYVGARREHKNLDRLMRAISIVRKIHNIELVLSGEPDRSTQIASLHHGIAAAVGYAGTASDLEMAALYRGATLTVMPSLYEGFGLPVVEAMACGCPVVSSNAASLPEVGGAAAIYFDPLDIEAMAASIERVIEDSDLRQRMKKLGLENSSRYSWDRVVTRFDEILSGLQP